MSDRKELLKIHSYLLYLQLTFHYQINLICVCEPKGESISSKHFSVLAEMEAITVLNVFYFPYVGNFRLEIFVKLVPAVVYHILLHIKWV